MTFWSAFDNVGTEWGEKAPCSGLTKCFWCTRWWVWARWRIVGNRGPIRRGRWPDTRVAAAFWGCLPGPSPGSSSSPSRPKKNADDPENCDAEKRDTFFFLFPTRSYILGASLIIAHREGGFDSFFVHIALYVHSHVDLFVRQREKYSSE